jgi:hypothetical protein
MEKEVFLVLKRQEYSFFGKRLVSKVFFLLAVKIN